MNEQISIYTGRRQRLMSTIGQKGAGLLASAAAATRTGDSDYRYRQNSDFYYLTGLLEPESVLVLLPGRAEGEAVLFLRDRDPAVELWDGPRIGVEGACPELGVDQAFPIEDLSEQLFELLQGRDELFYPIYQNPVLDELVGDTQHRLQGLVRRGVNAPKTFSDISVFTSEMRLIKDKHEIAIMQKSADISVEAHIEAIKTCKPNQSEYEAEALLHYHFARQGSREPAYTSIVGGGNNACVLHYINNDQPLKDGDLVLVDAGGEYQLYASDITRTYPVNGKYSEPQRLVYEAVLKVQQACIKLVRPGLSWDDYNAAAIRGLTEGMVEIGLLQGDVDQLIESGDYKRFYPHMLGHWIGLDTHDVGQYKPNGEWRKLEAGMCLTCEPGIYIPEGSEGVDEKWWGIGVRIEDDLVVTEDGCHVMTAKLPKTVEDIESLMAS